MASRAARRKRPGAYDPLGAPAVLPCACGQPMVVRIGAGTYKLPAGMKAGDEFNGRDLEPVRPEEVFTCPRCGKTTRVQYMPDPPLVN